MLTGIAPPSSCARSAAVQVSKAVRPPAAGLFDIGADLLRCVGGLTEQYLPRGGDVDFFNRLVAALGRQIEGVHRVDLVAPKLHAGGLLHVGRVDVRNVAADRKLTRPSTWSRRV